MVGIDGVQDLFGARANEIAFGEIDPTDGAVGVEQKFGGARYVCIVGVAGVGMHEIPLADELQLFVTEE